MPVGRGGGAENGQAPFRRVIDRSVRAVRSSRSPSRDVRATPPHLDVHVAAAVDSNGGTLGVESFPTTTAGFASLHAWLRGFGPLERVGVEGPARTAPAWPAICVVSGWRSSRLIDPAGRPAAGTAS